MLHGDTSRMCRAGVQHSDMSRCFVYEVIRFCRVASHCLNGDDYMLHEPELRLVWFIFLVDVGKTSKAVVGNIVFFICQSNYSNRVQCSTP